MSSLFPTALDSGVSLPDPSTSNNTNSPSHAGLHANANDAIKKLEAKLGIVSSTPAANQILVGTGTGSSAWQGLTSSQLAGIISDETGTGSAVFATTPTLVTPKVDTINENTATNGVTIDGLNIKDSALNTSSSVPTAALQSNSVTKSKISFTSFAQGGELLIQSGTISFTVSSASTRATQTVTFTTAYATLLFVGVNNTWDASVNAQESWVNCHTQSTTGAGFRYSSPVTGTATATWVAIGLV